MQTVEKGASLPWPPLRGASAPQEYEILKVQSIHSLIAVPIFTSCGLKGFVGIDNPREGHDEISIHLLTDIGGHLGSVRENLRSTKMLTAASAARCI